MTDKYMVLRDTREKEGQGWTWRASKYCAGTEIQKLDTGDYTLAGFEHLLTIERKKSISEWAKNVTEPRFRRELERLDGFREPWILLEFDMSAVMNYPVGSGIPRSKWPYLKFKGPFILKKMTEILINHRTKIVLCGANGKVVASNIFKRVIEKYAGAKE